MRWLLDIPRNVLSKSHDGTEGDSLCNRWRCGCRDEELMLC